MSQRNTKELSHASYLITKRKGEGTIRAIGRSQVKRPKASLLLLASFSLGLHKGIDCLSWWQKLKRKGKKKIIIVLEGNSFKFHHLLDTSNLLLPVFPLFHLFPWLLNLSSQSILSSNKQLWINDLFLVYFWCIKSYDIQLSYWTLTNSDSSR